LGTTFASTFRRIVSASRYEKMLQHIDAQVPITVTETPTVNNGDKKADDTL
jgi:hypothetical protein